MVECWKTVLLGWAGAVTVCGAGEWSVRVLPEPAETNAVTLRLGLQAGFLDGRFHPLRAECLAGPDWSAEPGVTLQAAAAAEPVDRPVRVVHGGADGGAERRGITQVTRPLRRGVRHTLRLHGRRIAGSGSVWVTFTPVGGTAEDGVTQRVSLKNGLWGAHDLPVIPQRETAYRCRLAVKPGSGVELGSLSLTPDDAEAGWDHEALEALRAMRPGVIGWPAAKGLGPYVWYDGVGPKAVRRPAVPSVLPEEGHTFGTAEYVAFCRLAGAEPMLRVTVFEPELADERVPDEAAGIRMAAEWVAYCNATGGHPLALLRQRHGQAEPLRVTRWELATRNGEAPSAASAAAYAAAMRAEDPAIRVTTCGEATLLPRSDRYVAEILQRLEAAPLDERIYYAEWYGALGLACAALDRVAQGRGGRVATLLQPEQVLYRVPRARNMLTDVGALLALINRYPAGDPLPVEGAPAASDAPLRVQAARSDEAGGLVLFLYNAGTETHTVRIDLAALRRPFMLWVSDQMAADLTARRASRRVPVIRIQKIGAAVSQTLVCVAAPCSFTRVLIKE